MLAPSTGAAIFFSSRPALNTARVKRARCIAHTYSVPRHRPRHLTKKVVASLDQPKLFCTAASTSVSSSTTLSATASEGKAGQVFCSKSGKNRKARHSILWSHWSIWPCSRINESGVEREASRKRSVQVQLLVEQHFSHPHIHEVVPTMIRRIVFAQSVLHQPRMNESEPR